MVFAADTIAAIATAHGTGAIAVIRVSGPQALETVRRAWKGPRLDQPRRAVLGHVVDAGGAVIDEVLATFFRAPASYTGEDVVEISCHGGVFVTRRVLGRLVEAGARPAEPGEFTQRAFLHGRMDLTQAEAVMDIISAQGEAALRAAQQQRTGALRDTFSRLRERCIDLLAELEAHIDFPEEDVSPESFDSLAARIAVLRDDVAALLQTVAQRRLAHEGVEVAIVGPPNAGKSSLLNCLLGFERSIVSALPGTTRDTVEETISLGGVPVRFIDTAGLRETDDPLERAGIDRSRRAQRSAAVVVEVADAAEPPVSLPENTGSVPVLRVLNKADLPEHAAWAGRDGLRVSCRTGAGLAEFRAALAEAVTAGAGVTTASVAINERHEAILRTQHELLATTLEHFPRDPVALAEAVTQSCALLDELLGLSRTEDVLGAIFARFCIGK